MDDGTWMTFAEASSRLGISTEALRRRADRGRWSRAKGNDGKTRVLVPETPVRTMSEARANGIQTMSEARANGVQTMSEPKHADTTSLVSALEAHIATLKAELAAERNGRQADQEQLSIARAATDKVTAELAGERDRAGERITAIEARLREETIRAERAMADLAGEQAARRADAKLAEMRDDDVTILREDQAAQLAQRDAQLAAARLAADKATAELVALAQRLAAIAEERASLKSAEPPRRSRLGRAWAWFLRN